MKQFPREKRESAPKRDSRNGDKREFGKKDSAKKPFAKKEFGDKPKTGFAKKPPMRGNSTVYLGNLNYARTEDDLRQLMLSFGAIKYIDIIKDEKTKKNKGIAFIRMEDVRDAEKAVRALNGSILDNRTLKASIATDKIGNDFSSRQKPKSDKPFEKKIADKKPSDKKLADKKVVAKKPMKKDLDLDLEEDKKAEKVSKKKMSGLSILMDMKATQFKKQKSK